MTHFEVEGPNRQLDVVETINAYGTHNRCDAQPVFACVDCHLIQVRENLIVWDDNPASLRRPWRIDRKVTGEER